MKCSEKNFAIVDCLPRCGIRLVLPDLSCLLRTSNTFGLFVFELSASEDRKFCFWLLKKQDKINHLCWINNWLWVTHECSSVLASRWDEQDTFMWLDCLTCSLNLSQGLPKNNCYWVEKWRLAGIKSTVYSTTTSATYLFVMKWRWKRHRCHEGKMRVNLFPPEPHGPSLLCLCHPHPRTSAFQ